MFNLRRVNGDDFRLRFRGISEAGIRHAAAVGLLHLWKLRENCHAVEDVSH